MRWVRAAVDVTMSPHHTLTLAVLLLVCVPTTFTFGPFRPHTADGRKLFGGYRIVPQSCKSEADSRHGVCMFNYECAQRKGEVIAACMDGFLFGACCLLPPGSQIPVEANNKPVKPAIPAPSTVGFVHEMQSTSNPVQSSTLKIKVSTALPPIPALRPVSQRPTPPTFKPTRKTTPRPQATVIPDEHVDNQASISHILNLLNDSSGIAEPIPSSDLELVFTTATSRPQPSLSTWVSVNDRRPVQQPTTNKPTISTLVSTPGLSFVVSNGVQTPLTPRPTPSAPAPTVIVLGPFDHHHHIHHTPDVISRPPGNPDIFSRPTGDVYRPEVSSPEPVVAEEEEPAFTVTTVPPEFSTPRFEDNELNNKVHVFVDKIVNSLAGDFQNLEDVVLSNKNITIKVTTTQPPSTTTRKPPRRPSTAKPFTTTKPPKKPTSPTLLVTEAVEAEVSESESAVVPSKPEPDFRKECGVRPLVKNGRIVGGKGATFGEWPWQVLVRESTWLGLFTKNKCGGVLITSKYVITAAHCQPGFLASLVAVFGEFDLSSEAESKRAMIRNVRRVIIHRHYEPATFENDIALLELETPVVFDKHIVPICLPDDSADFTGRMATVSGWGRLKYGGGVPSVLQEVQVPVIENSVCQEMFHTAGHAKSIISSFLCAGYANGQKDSCEGDSGGPLVVEQNGHWVLVGTVSHGIKCASPYLPGVYMRTTYYKPWLKTITGAS